MSPVLYKLPTVSLTHAIIREPPSRWCATAKAAWDAGLFDPTGQDGLTLAELEFAHAEFERTTWRGAAPHLNATTNVHVGRNLDGVVVAEFRFDITKKHWDWKD